jgi:integrase
MPSPTGMQIYDPHGHRLYLTGSERAAFRTAAEAAPREVRTYCWTLLYTGCRPSEALALTADRVDAPPVRDPVPDRARQAAARRHRHAPHRDWSPGGVHGPKSLHRALSDTRLHDPESLPQHHQEDVRVGAPRSVPRCQRRRARSGGVCPPHGTICARLQHVSQACHRWRGTPALALS